MTKSRDLSNSGHSIGSTSNRPASPFIGQEYFDTTLGTTIVYTGCGWEPTGNFGFQASAPTSVSATSQGSVSFVAPTNIGIYRLYNVALTGTQIAQNYTANKARYGLS